MLMSVRVSSDIEKPLIPEPSENVAIDDYTNLRSKQDQARMMENQCGPGQEGHGKRFSIMELFCEATQVVPHSDIAGEQVFEMMMLDG